MSKSRLLAAVFSLLFAISGCSNRGNNAATSATATPTEPHYAFITTGVADFWEYSRSGAEAAAQDLGVAVSVIMPNNMTDQTRKIEDLLVRGTDGIAISPIDPDNQIEILNKAAGQTNLVTHDSDAPQSNRLLYIGLDNYDAGIICGRTLRQAMPGGGKVMILIGRMDQENAKRRRQGCIDGLLGREPDPNRNDPVGDEVSSEDKKFTVLGTMTDQFDRAKAKANAEDVLTRHPDIAAMVGLFEYNPPLIMEALERAGKLGAVKVMGFDENPILLQGIKDGTAVATVVQNPYQYGYKSIQVLNELHKGDKSAIPESKFIDIPARVIDASNVDAFQQEIKALLSKK